ncbi:hypothetical protein BaRGS_00028752 [Batillaria attramentaria]|uniref:U3 small nucleolar ribonucleoprotein protein MPP10 n=1 Tax=Batillaria attramentaria TaxID=370345 RepID=A0ABD0JYE8_9CAEN
MASLVEALVARTFKEFDLLTRKPEERFKIRADEAGAARLKKSTKAVYDFTHLYDKTHCSEFVPELITDDFDDEQVWQELELQNEASTRGLLDSLATTDMEHAQLNFSSSSKRVSSKTQQQSETGDNSEEGEDESGVHGTLDSEDDGESDSDQEMAQIKKRLAKHDKDDGAGLFDGADSDDEDLFQGGSDKDGENDSDENEDDNLDFDFELSESAQDARRDDALSKDKTKKSEKKKRKTEVDDKFFKLADMEEFLQQEDEREEKKQKRATRSEEGESSDSEEDDDDIDMFAELPEDETEEGAMYNDFFDPPEDEDGPQKKNRTAVEDPAFEDKQDKGSMEQSDEDVDDGASDMEDDAESDELEADDGDEPSKKKRKVHFSKDTKGSGQGLLSSESEGEDVTEVLDRTKSDADSLSTFEKRQEKLRRQIAAMEDASLQEKPWQMAGEVGATLRPENSLLEEHVSFDHTSRAAPEITEETTKSLEDIIRQRIKDKAWDDVERKHRTKEEPYEFKKRVQLDQEKSKMSLSQIYEQEYLKQQAEEEDEVKTNPQHDEIKKMMDTLFRKLDALSNFHYTPKPAAPEVKIVSNMPSIAMEEVTPVAVSDAALLAPEEIKARSKGELKGKAERTTTDKKRERRLKKAAKRERQREKEKRQKVVEKLNPGLGNKYSKERAMRDLEKQSKMSGNIELVKGTKEKGLKSSKNFFSQLQEEVTTHVKSKMASSKKEKKNKTSKNYLFCLTETTANTADEQRTSFYVPGHEASLECSQPFQFLTGYI